MGQKRQQIAEEEAARQAQKNEQQESQSQENEVETVAAEVQAQEAVEETEAQDKKRWGNGKARISKIDLLDTTGKKKSVFETAEDIVVRVQYKVKSKVEDAVFGIGVFRADGAYCYGTNTRIDKLPEFSLEEDGTLEIHLKNMMLLPGKYTLDLAIESEVGIPVDYFREAVEIEIYSTKEDVGLVRIEHDWKF